MAMTNHDQPDSYTVESILRNHKPVSAFCVSLEHPIMVRNEELDPSKVKKVNGGKKHTVAELLKLINIQHLTRAELKKQFLDAKIASDGTFNTLFKEAVDTKIFEQCEDGKKWKAVDPVYPPGYDTCNSKTEENGAKEQK